MKRIVLLTAFVLLLLSGCSRKEAERKVEEEMYKAYLTYYQALLDTKDKDKKSQEFDVSVAVNDLGSGKYRYDVIIDNPRVAMYGIEALAIIHSDATEPDSKAMMPSVGIFSDFFSMVPGQVYKDLGYVKGVVLSLTSEEKKLDLDLIVCWHDKDNTVSYKRFLSLSGEFKSGD